ncbi:sulfurtransferase [Winogradskyella ursingii]|uniref:sulfurtransferase n=1 Tax=Winogradskyella ursingii TaxID=2686079 RepID=UPI0015CA666F|nr:sulfurtransferase [Winogradskyella ursingii]
MDTNRLNSVLVSVKWLQKEIDNPNLIILDATINKKISESALRIPKARFFDIKQKFSDVNSIFPSTLPSAEQFQSDARKLGINEDSLIIVYDDKGIYSSPRAWWLFKTFGFDNVAVLNGGLPEWRNKGFLVESYSSEHYSIGNIEVNFNSDLITDYEGLQDFILDSERIIIDARSSERFNCQVPEPREGLRRGNIPSSINLHYQELLIGNKLKSKTSLLELLEPLSRNKKKVVFSCGSGITACILALAATICNFKNITVYDGSWTEYGSLTT